MRAGHYLAGIACVAAASATGRASAQTGRADALDRARALDQQGVRAFREGRYNDAVRYFEEALKLGGPSSELWNIAKCQVKLDQPEAASESLERYLSRGDLSPEDRASAKKELDELARRQSTVTVASSPTGALVAVDGKRIGRTPTSIDVGPGEHTIAVQQEGYPPHIERVAARYGRAIIVDAQLSGDRGGVRMSTDSSGETAARHLFTASAEAAGLFARLGSLGRPLYPAALLSLGYVAFESAALDFALGARLTITDLSWNDTVGAPALACGLGADESSVLIAAFGDAAIGYRFSGRWRVGGDAGFGFASLPSSSLGGDAFVPSCKAAPGLAAAGHFGADVSYRVLPAMRVVLSPLVFEVDPSFAGARKTPVDASGAWIRVGAGLGLAIDL